MKALTQAEQQKHKALSKLFWAFPGQSGSSWGSKLAAYMEALSRMPPDLVEEACNAAIKGKIGKPTFLPSAAEIYQYTENLSVEISRRSARDNRPWVAVPYPERVAVQFNPAGKTFSPYKLGLSQEQIRKCVMAYRKGEDWQPIHRQAVLENDSLANKWMTKLIGEPLPN